MQQINTRYKKIIFSRVNGVNDITAASSSHSSTPVVNMLSSFDEAVDIESDNDVECIYKYFHFQFIVSPLYNVVKTIISYIE